MEIEHKHAYKFYVEQFIVDFTLTNMMIV